MYVILVRHGDRERERGREREGEREREEREREREGGRESERGSSPIKMTMFGLAVRRKASN